MTAAIEVRGLRKSYQQVEAVRGIDLDVATGEVLAVLGPNGAGKTTTVEILEGFRPRDGGEVRVLGVDPATGGRELRKRLGILLQGTVPAPYLTVEEALRQRRRWFPRPRGVDELISLVGLEEQRHTRLKALSGGQQRRVELALALIGNPDLIFLDEPTTGFDPGARRATWEIIRQLTVTGTTVLLTTHYMEEAQVLADRVAVMAGGRIVAEGTPDSIGGRDLARARIRFRLPEGTSLAELPLPSQVDRDAIVVETDIPTRVLHELTGWALQRGVELAGLTVSRPSLEDVYLSLAGDENR
jgi:ABC-2 type transport system ATP-binding protein